MLAIGLDRAEKCEIRSIMGKIYSNKAGAAQFSRAARLTQSLTLSIFRAIAFFFSAFTRKEANACAEAAGYGEDPLSPFPIYPSAMRHMTKSSISADYARLH